MGAGKDWGLLSGPVQQWTECLSQTLLQKGSNSNDGDTQAGSPTDWELIIVGHLHSALSPASLGVLPTLLSPAEEALNCRSTFTSLGLRTSYFCDPSIRFFGHNVTMINQM